MRTKTIQLEGDKFKVVTQGELTNRLVKLLERKSFKYMSK